MERLTTMVGENTFIKKVIDESCESVCINEYDCINCPIQEAFRKLAHYEDLEEQGRLIELPCKVGEIIYEVHNNEIHTNRLVTKWKIARYLEEGFFDELVFTTKEEAEAKLKELKEGVE